MATYTCSMLTTDTQPPGVYFGGQSAAWTGATASAGPGQQTSDWLASDQYFSTSQGMSDRCYKERQPRNYS